MRDPHRIEIPGELETERLRIRAVRADDAALLYPSSLEVRPILRRYPASFPWAVEESTLEAVSAYCRDAAERFSARDAFPFLVFLRDGEHVGNCALHDLDWKVPKCEVGYWQRPSLCGRGLMTEAIAAVTAFAFERLGMRRVEALPEARNEASRRLCERVGLVLEGTLRNYRAAPDGTLTDVCMYAATR
jgi:RimJ/RimL family protein N-acetyltransferase